jgi:hypothetical protein
MGTDMKRWAVWFGMSLVLMIVASYAWTDRHHLLPGFAAEQPQPPTEATYAEAQEAQKMVAVSGPLADAMLGQKPANVLTLPPVVEQTSAVDRVGESPVGTSTELLKKTFRVNGIVDLPFEIPAHAATPTLHGTYRSFLGQSGIKQSEVKQSNVPQSGGQDGDSASSVSISSDAAADVEFLVLNERQFGDFINGRPADAIFSADSAHDGEVNFSLPPSLSKSTWYYLVFRNGSPTGDKKIVQADFRVDF